MFQTEMCVENYDGALKAVQAQANSIELCDNLAVGGTTPSYGVLKSCITNIPLPITVLIRPRGGNFVYTKQEIDIVTDDIHICRQLGYQYIRVGALTENHKLDIPSLKRWKDEAGEMQIGCHMAFDEIPDYFEGIDELTSLGYTEILTKGGKKKGASENHLTLAQMITYTQGKITIIPGSGISYHNASLLHQQTKARKLHGTKIVKI